MTHLLPSKLIAALVAASVLLSFGPTRATEPNTLSPQEVAQGWTLLFDGHTAAGWHIYGTKLPPSKNWTVESGCLVNPKSSGRPNGSGGDLVSNALYTDFEFRFEWKVTTGGNSGIHYLFTEGAKRTASMYKGDKGDSPVGFEYQILDDPAYADKQGPDHLTASFYWLLAPVNKTLRPVGEFNEGRIVVNGNHVEHWLNGVKVAECELGSPALQKLIAGSKFKVIPGYGTKAATALALQDHGEEVAFRNLMVRELRH